MNCVKISLMRKKSSLIEAICIIYFPLYLRSMYFDEDGELAHEFYEEVLPKKKGGKRKMRRVDSKSLTPQVNHLKNLLK